MVLPVALVPIAIEVKGSFTNVWPTSVVGRAPQYDVGRVSVHTPSYLV
jgi:hypothetical protein